MTNQSDARKLYTLEQAAELLSCSPWTLRSHKQRGTLKTVNIGRAVRVPIAEIERIEREGLGSLTQISSVAA